jgi:hypothetical protein
VDLICGKNDCLFSLVLQQQLISVYIRFTVSTAIYSLFFLLTTTRNHFSHPSCNFFQSASMAQSIPQPIHSNIERGRQHVHLKCSYPHAWYHNIKYKNMNYKNWIRYILKSRGSAVGIEPTYELDEIGVEVRVLEGLRITISPYCTDWFLGPPSLQSNW